MPFLDWVNQAQTVQAAGSVPRRLLSLSLAQRMTDTVLAP